ncbi:MAG: hypothetical protein M1405_02475 [Patescibacteria group bacterium]|nr:hypothetical protein [Patescibacteria group bacterium]
MFKNKTLVVVAAAVILALLGGAAYLTLSKSSKTGNQATNATPATQKQENAAKSFMDILSSGISQKCTFDMKVESTESSGVLYVSAGKLRGDITTTVEGKKQNISMIRNGDTNYIWGSAIPQGIKMTVPEKDFASDTKTGQYFNPNEKADYKCSPWIVDSSLFAPPANVKFTDISAMMPKTSGAPTTGGAGFSCAGITDPSAKAACENALKSQNNGY